MFTGKLTKKPNGRWAIVNSTDEVELTSGDMIEVYIEVSGAWIPTRIESSALPFPPFEVEYYAIGVWIYDGMPARYFGR